MLEDCLIILFASFASALFAEGLSWLLVYRTENYKALQAKIAKLQLQVDKKKDDPVPVTNKSKTKRLERYDEQLKSANSELTMSKTKSMLAVGLTLVSLFGILNSHFGGRVIARLPFEPWPLVRNISHGGLSGTDYYDCSMAFLYALCSISIRTNLQKFFGFTPPKTGAGLFGAPTST
eukprot:TRINITY_DN583_c0_g3_i1.p1 TRINITY_DN583_c0_g3~~TRINITY_DN583_c0_g3_i1.p1  ORF type:complete len:178 (-),score=20.18 TRINITY_DN583_c0_g3_i1:186-719(-)